MKKTLIIVAIVLAIVGVIWAQQVVKTTGADTIANTLIGYWAASSDGTPLILATQPHVYNGTTHDQMRGDTKGLEVHGSRNGFNCVVAVSTATSLTAVGNGCVAPGAGLSLYITDVEFGSSAASGTAADSFPTLKSGTGGTCGSSTAVVWQGLSVANTTIISNMATPTKITANNELCWIMSTAGSKTIQIRGFIAP